MKNAFINLIGMMILAAIPAMQKGRTPTEKEKMMQDQKNPHLEIPTTEGEWKKILTRMQYYVLREKGTERPFTGKYDKFFEKGTYTCAGCGNVLFASEAKYNSGCGWPAFSAPADPNAIAERRDTSHGMIRTEIYCPKCGGHLGHVFTDGPKPAGLRYCINSAALEFQKEQKASDPNTPKQSEAEQHRKTQQE